MLQNLPRTRPFFTLRVPSVSNWVRCSKFSTSIVWFVFLFIFPPLSMFCLCLVNCQYFNFLFFLKKKDNLGGMQDRIPTDNTLI